MSARYMDYLCLKGLESEATSLVGIIEALKLGSPDEAIKLEAARLKEKEEI